MLKTAFHFEKSCCLINTLYENTAARHTRQSSMWQKANESFNIISFEHIAILFEKKKVYFYFSIFSSSLRWYLHHATSLMKNLHTLFTEVAHLRSQFLLYHMSPLKLDTGHLSGPQPRPHPLTSFIFIQLFSFFSNKKHIGNVWGMIMPTKASIHIHI